MDETQSSRRVIQDYARLLIAEHDPLRAFAAYFSPTIIQHDPDIGDGGEGDEEFLEGRREAHPDDYLPLERYETVVHNILADGELVALKSHCFTSRDDPGRVFVDMWRVEDGRLAEHWSAVETIPSGSANPVPMWCGRGRDYQDAAACGDTVAAPICGDPGDPDLRASSLETVRAYLDALQGPARIADAVERFVAEDFVEYGPRLGQGRRALVQHLSAMAARGERFQPARWLADGELVLVHGLATDPDRPLGWSQMHLFRVAGGRVVAHWAVRQAIPPYSVAGHSMVDGPLEPGRSKGGPAAAGH